MNFNVIRKAVKTFTDQLTESSSEKFRLYTNPNLHKYGFFSIEGAIDDKIIALITQDIYSADCVKNPEVAEKWMIKKIYESYGA